MELRLKEKVVLITGGAKGIGLRIARGFADEGSRIGVCDRDPDALTAAASELRGRGARVARLLGDVTQPAVAAALVGQCASELGGVDILINNAGGSFGGKVVDATDEDWAKTFEINVFQAIRMIRLALPHIQTRGGGAIVNIASISGWQPQLCGPPQYGASKAALIFLTEPIALELARHNIRVNTVSPSSTIWEGGGWDRFRQANPESFQRYVADGFPAGRLGNPEEIADVVVFLASERASWVNGRNIPVDGLEQPVPVRERRQW